MKKQTIIGCVIWTVLCAAMLLVYFLPFGKTSGGWRNDQDYTVSDDRIYITDTVDDRGVLYSFDLAGKKKDLFIARRDKSFKQAQAEGVVWKAPSLYALFSMPTLEKGKEGTVYQLVRFDDGLHIQGVSDYLNLGGTLKITHVSADDTTIYITAINASGSEAYTYGVATDAVRGDYADGMRLGVGKKDDSETLQTVEVKPMTETAPEEGRVFADAAYEPGQLFTRYENETPAVVFSVPENVQSAYDHLRVSPAVRRMENGFHFLVLIMIWAIGIPVIILISTLLYGKSRMVYTAFITESLLIIIFLVVATLIVRIPGNVSLHQAQGYAGMVMASLFENTNLSQAATLLGEGLSEEEKEKGRLAFYDSRICTEMETKVTDCVALMGEDAGMTNLMIVNQVDGEILLSDKRDNRLTAEGVCGKGIVDAYLTADTRIKTTEATVMGEKRTVITKSLSADGLQGYVLIGVFDQKMTLKEGIYRNRFVLIGLGVIFLISSIIMMTVFALENAEIHGMARMLKKMAEGKEIRHNPNVHGKDLKSMKNSIYEIQKNIASVNHSKFKIFEAYYRFAPKSVETMLGMNSITEVASGDHAFCNGTMAIVSMKQQRRIDPESMEQINHVLRVMEEERETFGGIYITNNENLSRIRFLFPEDVKKTVAFGTEVLHGLSEHQRRVYKNCMILLHYTTYFYGVCGTETQSMAFLESRETERLSEMVDWLRGLRLSLVVTGSVLNREEDLGETRYIGFVLCDNQIRIDLYEVLQAQPKRMQTAKLATREAFENALKMFYDKDFFLARNEFADILRESPDDSLVRWYLFECEKRLDDAEEESFTGALHK